MNNKYVVVRKDLNEKFRQKKNVRLIIIGIAAILLVSIGVIGIKNYKKLVRRSYVGTYKLHNIGGYYLGKGTNDDDKMEYVFQVEPIDGSGTLSDNIDVTEGVTVKKDYTEAEKQSILKIANKSISQKSMDTFKNNLGKNDTVSVFAVSYKNWRDKITTRYEYEILIDDGNIKDFDKDK